MVESTPLLRERSPKGYRGFESLSFRHHPSSASPGWGDGVNGRPPLRSIGFERRSELREPSPHREAHPGIAKQRAAIPLVPPIFAPNEQRQPSPWQTTKRRLPFVASAKKGHSHPKASPQCSTPTSCVPNKTPTSSITSPPQTSISNPHQSKPSHPPTFARFNQPPEDHPTKKSPPPDRGRRSKIQH